jgi:hypothetical protein
MYGLFHGIRTDNLYGTEGDMVKISVSLEDVVAY